MSQQIPTIKIAHGDDYMVINESDFDPTVHKVFGAPKGSAKKQAAAEPFGLAEMNADDAKALIASVTAVEQLEAIAAEEQDGKARRGVLSAVEARRVELEG